MFSDCGAQTPLYRDFDKYDKNLPEVGFRSFAPFGADAPGAALLFSCGGDGGREILDWGLLDRRVNRLKL